MGAVFEDVLDLSARNPSPRPLSSLATPRGTTWNNSATLHTQHVTTSLTNAETHDVTTVRNENIEDIADMDGSSLRQRGTGIKIESDVSTFRRKRDEDDIVGDVTALCKARDVEMDSDRRTVRRTSSEEIDREVTPISKKRFNETGSDVTSIKRRRSDYTDRDVTVISRQCSEAINRDVTQQRSEAIERDVTRQRSEAIERDVTRQSSEAIERDVTQFSRQRSEAIERNVTPYSRQRSEAIERDVTAFSTQRSEAIKRDVSTFKMRRKDVAELHDSDGYYDDDDDDDNDDRSASSSSPRLQDTSAPSLAPHSDKNKTNTHRSKQRYSSPSSDIKSYHSPYLSETPPLSFAPTLNPLMSMQLFSRLQAQVDAVSRVRDHEKSVRSFSAGIVGSVPSCFAPGVQSDILSYRPGFLATSPYSCAPYAQPLSLSYPRNRQENSQGELTTRPPSSKNTSSGVNFQTDLKKQPELFSDSDTKHSDYLERRRKNNEAAKRSRDSRRMKEEGTASRAAFLEQENIQLKAELQMWRAESAKLHRLIYDRL